MQMISPLLSAACGTGFIFAMSVLGSALVFFFASQVQVHIQSVFMGFASGVMLAASVWSLLIPSMELGGSLSLPCWVPAAAGIILGSFFLYVLDGYIRRLSRFEQAGNALLVTAITMHNIPEGMAVGLAFALAADREGLAAASALALGIGIQNLPEGAAVALPLRHEGVSRLKAFGIGAASGAVEPVFGMLAVLAAAVASPLMPWLLGFAAGAMLYVCVSELIPSSCNIGGISGFMLGFILMMVLDVSLG